MGAMSYSGTGFLHTVIQTLNGMRYIDVLENCMVPSAHLLGYGDNYTFQDDGAPCHRSKIVKQWKDDQDIQCREWPAQSPDLNPIENLWNDVGVRCKANPSRNLRQLEDRIHQYWGEIPRERCEKLVRSLPDGIAAVVAARGGYTRY